MKNIHEHLSPQEIRELICELCKHFYHLGWASGTGGGMSIRKGNRIFMAPSGVQKERLSPDDIFVLDENGDVVESAAGNLRVSECQPLFMHAFKKRDAGAVLHSHSLNAVAATWLFEKEFVVKDLEMMKGIPGVGVFESHCVPIIPNTEREAQLTDSLGDAIDAYPESYAVLVAGHGVYVWGNTWEKAKTQAECYDYLFAAALRRRQLGLD